MSELSFTRTRAGKVTILTTVVGIAAFAAIFLLNFGAQELQKVEAQGVATTTLTVLNTPPQWTVMAEETVGSSTTTPTNSTYQVRWQGTATDPNGQPYFLLLCNTSNPPTASSASSYGNLGSAPPSCSATSTRWAVSASTTSGVQAIAATTTTESMAESNDWWAWVCDDDPVLPRCNAVSSQGTGTTSSPFLVNHRPVVSSFTNNSPTLPGSVVTFTSSSSDPDVVSDPDTVKLFVCSTNSFSTTTETCGATQLASSTFVTSNATATYTITIPTQDQNYDAYGFIIDNHSHLASPQAGNSQITVQNAPPTVTTSQVILNGGNNIVLTQHASQTTGFTLQFELQDNNTCENASSGDELVDYQLAVFRTNIGTSTCTPGATFNPNNCYPSEAGTNYWNLSCTASSTSCGGPPDMTTVFSCTFPLWYVADPTSGGATNTVHFATDWSAAIIGIDDNGATSSYSIGDFPQELNSFLGYTLDTLAIPYGQLEPGQATDPLVASTTFRATGNVGLDETLSGESMCNTYTTAVNCPDSATSTISETQQVFATSTVSYATALGFGYNLSSSSFKELELNVQKSTATNTQATSSTYWGISVPGTITYSGVYTGENTFIGVVGEPADW